MLRAAETDSSSALAGVNPGFCGSSPHHEGLDIYIYIFNFFCRLREISRNFLSVIRLHKENQLLGVLERRALSDCTLSTLVGDTKLGGGGDTPC